uniref:Possible major surface glycoprotein n=1 Tax=Pneumocystis carinii TaxID=4754 RepID=Q96VJ0_PNECA|nr:possible major surface glycoprotein [Pneumocystis carinii]
MKIKKSVDYKSILKTMEEEILAYISKEDYKDKDKCEVMLKEYCEELKGIDSELNKVYSKVKEISGNIEQKCKNPELKIHEKVDDLCNYIYLFMNTSITCKDCNEHIQKCLFLESTKIHGSQTTAIALKNCIIYAGKKKKETKLFLELLALDSPKEKDCIELKEDCEGILKDLGLNNGKCVTLKERCEYFKVRKELEYAFLKEESDALADNQKFMKALKDKCDKLSEKEKNLYHVSCNSLEETCKFMVPEAMNHCDILKKNMGEHKINCPDTLKKGSNSHDEKGVCLQLKDNCKPLWVEKKLEDKPAKEEEKKVEDKPAKEEEKKVEDKPAKEEEKKVEDKPSKEEVKPNEGIKIKVTEMIKIMFLGVIVMGMM